MSRLDFKITKNLERYQKTQKVNKQKVKKKTQKDKKNLES